MNTGLMFKNDFYVAGTQAVSMDDRKSPTGAIEKSISYMIQNFAEDLTLDDVAQASGITKFNLCRSFQKRFSVTPMKWLWCFRTLLAGEFISMAPTWSLTDVAFTCGFTSSAHFSRSFSAVFGKSPSEYRALAKSARRTETKENTSNSFGLIYDDNEELVNQAYQRMIAHVGSMRMQ